MKPLAILLTLLPLGAFAAEIKSAAGKSMPYDEIIVSPEMPQSFVTLKNGNNTVACKYSEIDIESLPEDKRKAAKAYIQEQRLKRLIIKDDKWMHRDEMLLNSDKRYAAKGKLPRVGDSIIEFNNTTDGMVTLAVRQGDKGYEMHLEGGKKKGYQAPNGKVFYIMAQESPDGTQLVVQKSEVIDLKNVNLRVTIVTSDQIPPNEMGVIEIPKEYQVR